MRNFLKNSLRAIIILLGIIVLTSFSIDATDTFKTSQSALSIFAKKATEKSCPVDMVLISNARDNYCLDRFEASVGVDCPVITPVSAQDTASNINVSKCFAVSKLNSKPWVYVTEVQAEQLCAKSGKYLPNAVQWYEGALGTPDDDHVCNVNGSLSETGKNLACTSGSGTFDMIGNVWEFVSGEVNNGTYGNKKLALTGYVESINNYGLPQESTSTAQKIYNDDYFWLNSSGTFKMIRGGFYGSKSDGGIFSVHADIDSNFSSGAVSFRCAKNLY